MLVRCPKGASGDRCGRAPCQAPKALARASPLVNFAAVAKAMSEDANKAQGGEIGLRPSAACPTCSSTGRQRASSAASTTACCAPARAFILKVIERQGADSLTRSVQTHARHILLRISPQLTTETAARRLVEYKRQIEAGEVQFEKLARDYSEDGSAPRAATWGGLGPAASCPSSRKR